MRGVFCVLTMIHCKGENFVRRMVECTVRRPKPEALDVTMYGRFDLLLVVGPRDEDVGSFPDQRGRVCHT